MVPSQGAGPPGEDCIRAVTSHVAFGFASAGCCLLYGSGSSSLASAADDASGGAHGDTQ